MLFSSYTELSIWYDVLRGNGAPIIKIPHIFNSFVIETAGMLTCYRLAGSRVCKVPFSNPKAEVETPLSVC
jgi:hypothetical protein